MDRLSRTNLASIPVAVAAAGRFTFSGLAFSKPAAARRFLEAFASSARTHHVEQSLRLLPGLGDRDLLTPIATRRTLRESGACAQTDPGEKQDANAERASGRSCARPSPGHR